MMERKAPAGAPAPVHIVTDNADLASDLRPSVALLGREWTQNALGIVGMIGAPAMLVSSLFARPFSPAENALGLVYLTGFVASVIGLRRARVTGKGNTGLVVFMVQMIGLALSFSQNTMDLVGHRQSQLYAIANAAWPVSHVFMLVVGILAFRARVRSGWCSFTPFGCGLALPLAFAVGAAVGHTAMRVTFGILTMLSFMLLGNCVRKSKIS
jgi:hypothetical protein